MQKLLFIILLFHLLNGVTAQNEPYHGGNGDGYTQEAFNTDIVTVAIGGSGDGYGLETLSAEDNILSTGSPGDGYALSVLTDDALTTSLGDFGDGYSMSDYIKIYWTGNIGTAWLNVNNWSSNSIPTNEDEIIIPPGRPHYPLLGGQLLSIGNPNIETGFRCAELWVLEGASFSGKLNTTLSNQSLLRIDGTFIWLNPTTGSFTNHLGGVIRIGSGGVLMTDL